MESERNWFRFHSTRTSTSEASDATETRLWKRRGTIRARTNGGFELEIHHCVSKELGYDCELRQRRRQKRASRRNGRANGKLGATARD